NYKNFLLAVLETQPETIEDFMFQTHITNLLPPSSRNEIIYENCLEIVKSILLNDGNFDSLLNSNDSIIEIDRELKVRKNHLIQRERITKPQNYWILNFEHNNPIINLHLGLADRYTSTSLVHILGFEVKEKQYQ